MAKSKETKIENSDVEVLQEYNVKTNEGIIVVKEIRLKDGSTQKIIKKGGKK